MSLAALSVGQWVSVRSQEGQVRYVGPTGFAEGEWVGIELSTAVGRNDGTVRGVRYFTCQPRHGLFVQRAQCVIIDGPSGTAGDSGPVEEIASAWAAIEMVDEAAALQAGRESQRVLQHLSAQYPQGAATTAASGAAKIAPLGKLPPLKKRDSVGKETMRANRAHVRASLADSGEDGYDEVLAALEIPAGYTGPTFEAAPTEEDMAGLLQHIKQRVAAADAGGGAEAAVPQKVAMRLLLQVPRAPAARRERARKPARPFSTQASKLQPQGARTPHAPTRSARGFYFRPGSTLLGIWLQFLQQYAPGCRPFSSPLRILSAEEVPAGQRGTIWMWSSACPHPSSSPPPLSPFSFR